MEFRRDFCGNNAPLNFLDMFLLLLWQLIKYFHVIYIKFSKVEGKIIYFEVQLTDILSQKSLKKLPKNCKLSQFQKLT